MGWNDGFMDLHDEEPAEETPVATTSVDGRRVFTGVFGAPFES
jgi:hypothetical protein